MGGKNNLSGQVYRNVQLEVLQMHKQKFQIGETSNEVTDCLGWVLNKRRTTLKNEKKDSEGLCFF